jgi:hypothetical protein
VVVSNEARGLYFHSRIRLEVLSPAVLYSLSKGSQVEISLIDKLVKDQSSNGGSSDIGIPLNRLH